jgi:hypothetical protein
MELQSRCYQPRSAAETPAVRCVKTGNTQTTAHFPFLPFVYCIDAPARYLLIPYEASASVVRWEMTAATASRAVFPWSFPVAMTDRVAA